MASGSSSESNGQPVGEFEMKEMDDRKPALPVEDDIMQLARLGEIAAIQKLFDSGKYDATYKDDQGITPLHWAAINNHHALCHFLIKSGANVNAKGGDAIATPVLWAAKRCHYYVVNLLLEHGADPLLTDDQGFNLLHSATLDGNVYQLVLLLHQDIPVDIPDAQAHTALMWAAYKGYPSCVDLFLRWGANVYATDDQGFTALHWALVKGSQGSIQKLLEYGADRFAKNNDGKTPAVTAEEMNTKRQWHAALSQAGYNKDGTAKEFPVPKVKDTRWFISRFLYFWPFLIILFAVYLISHFPVYMGIPLAGAVAFGMQWVAQKLLTWAPSNMRSVHHTPWLAGIFSGTLFWVGVCWITTVMPGTLSDHFSLNLLFITFYGFTAYFYFMSMSADPGFVPKSASRSASKKVIDELMELRAFDENHFCVNCMVRKPLRSKHCKRCERCVAKSDHHCPWVNNCVANNNHRHFVLYVLSMELGIVSWVYLTLEYLDKVKKPKGVTCTILSDDLCEILHKDPYTIVLTIWAAFQLTWVTMLLVVQLIQIARNLTTYESMRGHLHDKTPADALNTFITTGDTTQDMTGNGSGNAPTNGFGSGQDTGDAASSRPKPKHSIWDQWKRLLGLDTFVATALQGSQAGRQQRRAGNPWSRGIVTNCKDFWCDGAPVLKARESGFARLAGERVDYTRLYEVPKMRYARNGGGGERYEAVGTEEDA